MPRTQVRSVLCFCAMSGSGKGLLGLWLYRSGEKEWALKEGSPIHQTNSVVVGILLGSFRTFVLHSPSDCVSRVPRNDHRSCLLGVEAPRWKT